MTDSDRLQRADRLLDRALDLSAAEREAFLDRECADDAELRALVARLVGKADATRTRDTSGVLAELVQDLSGTSLGRYRIVREIGRGGMGVVYEARDEQLDRTVAIKVLPARAIEGLARERFLREARAAAALNHPNIVAIHDAGEAAGRPYLVMEHVPGGSLDEKPPATLDEAVAIARMICDALDHAHVRGLVHRDLKPGNVLVARDGGTLVAKLTDMGIALTRGAARVTHSGAIAGTPSYMAPEQALGKEIDGRADLYSLGVMLYLWAAGRLPFQGDDALAVVSQHIHAPVVPPRTYRPDLPAGLEPLIVKLLSKTAEARHASAGEVRAALEAVDTERAAGAPAAAVTIEGLTRGRMIGRRKELERLQEMWAAAIGGHSHIALVSGEPGVGKTRLAFEITATAQLDGALVLSGGCYENEATTPYLPFLEGFRRFVRDRRDDELQRALGDSAGEIARLAPEIEPRLGPFPPPPSLPPQEERLRLFDHVARFLGRLAAPRGLLLFIDDLQWADHGSLALLHYLLRQLAAERILFLATYREIELDRAHPLSKALVDWNRERLATRVRLDRLDRRETRKMVATLLGQDDVSTDFAAALHTETEGNPFFVEEIVKALIAEGGLVREDASWKKRTTGEFVLPQSVKAAIGSRLERISASCGDVLRTAAVLGKTFNFVELVSVARRPEEELLDALDEAVAAQLVVAGRGESFAFTHDKIREVLYDEQNPIRRRRLHERIAEGLARLEKEGAAVSVEDLAYHFVQGGDYENGLHFADRAAESARRVFAYEEALEMLARARECADALEREEDLLRIDEAMGDVAAARGDLPAAVQHYERARAAGSAPDSRNRLRCKLGEAWVVSGDPRGREQAGAVLAEVDPARMPREAALAMMVEARYLHIDGQLARAAERYRTAIDLAESVGDPDLLVRLYSYFAGTLQHLADFDASNAIARRCIEIGEREELPAGVMFGYEFLAENAFFRGRWHDCVSASEKEEAVARESHAGERLGWAHFRAFALHPLGRIGEAQELFRRALEICKLTGDRRLELFLKMGLALCLLDTGRVTQADETTRGALQASDEAKLLSHRLVGRAYLVLVLLRQRRTEEAALEARIAVELWRTSGSKGVALSSGAWLAEGLVRGGTEDEALEALAGHRELAEATGAQHRLAQNLRVRALLAERQGRPAEARALYDQAVPMFEAAGSKIDLAHALLERGGEGDATRARKLLEGTGATPETLIGCSRR